MEHPRDRECSRKSGWCLFALIATAAVLLPTRSAFVAEMPWTGSAQCSLTVQSANYTHTETQTWVITGSPQLQGSLSVFPATWSVTGQGMRKDNQGGQTSTIQWNANVAPMDAPLVIWVRAVDNQIIIKSYHAQLRSNAGVLTRQAVARVKQPAETYVEYEWQFPSVHDVSTSTSISGSSSTDVPGGIGPMQPAGLPGEAVCQWHFIKGGTVGPSLQVTQPITQLSRALQPAVKTWVAQQAKAIAQSSTPDIPQLQVRAQAVIDGTGMDVDSLVQIVMMQAVSDTDQDLRDLLDEVAQQNETKRQLGKLMSQITDDASTMKGKMQQVCTTPTCQSLAGTLAQMAATPPLVKPSSNLAAQGRLTPVDLQQIVAQMKLAQASLDSLSQEEQAQLQAFQERKAKMEEALANLPK